MTDEEISKLRKALERREHTVNTDQWGVTPNWAIHSEDVISGFVGPFRFLSNFWPCPNGIVYMGSRFPTVEHAYQAAKYPVSDHHEFISISASTAKTFGRAATLPENWNDIKYDIMKQLVKEKFTSDPTLASQLKLTGKRILEERNFWGDTYWGVNLKGNGNNNLGKILMEIRLDITN